MDSVCQLYGALQKSFILPQLKFFHICQVSEQGLRVCVGRGGGGLTETRRKLDSTPLTQVQILL